MFGVLRFLFTPLFPIMTCETIAEMQRCYHDGDWFSMPIVLIAAGIIGLVFWFFRTPKDDGDGGRRNRPTMPGREITA